jgi:hypothetical protein
MNNQEKICENWYSADEKIAVKVSDLIDEGSETSNLLASAQTLHNNMKSVGDDDLVGATGEIFIALCDATVSDSLDEDERAVIAHNAELARLVCQCMRGERGITSEDVVFYKEEFSELREDVGLTDYEDFIDDEIID